MMSVRRFNFTGRKRLRHSNIAIAVEKAGDGNRTFSAALDLEEYNLPSDALVVVEAYRQTALRTFPFGSAAKPGAMGPTDLSGLPDAGLLLFRVKVIDVDEVAGRLLAEADRIRATDTEQGNRPSLIGVREANLSGELWCLVYEDDGPVLLLEQSLGPKELVLASPHFRWMVFPQLLREMLRRALRDAEAAADEDEDVSSWAEQVLRLGREMSAVEEPSEADEDAQEEWITSAVRAFCRRHNFKQRYSSELFGGGPS
jgi:hypothetical protein